MKTITAENLNTLMNRDEKAIVVDVLPRDHYEEGHIPGAHSVPLGEDDFVRRIGEIASSQKEPLVVYCANTECDLSPKAAKRLEEQGFDNVIDFEGGLKSWKESGFEVVS